MELIVTNINVDLDSAVKIILEWDTKVLGKPSIFQKFDIYYQAVDKILWLKRQEKFLLDERKLESSMNIARNQLMNLFKNMLSSSITPTLNNRSNYSSSSSAGVSSSSLDEYHDEQYKQIKNSIYDLNFIAQRMKTMGHLDECIQEYFRKRKSFLDATFTELGIKKLSIFDTQRIGWRNLEDKISLWVRLAPLCVHILFSMEKHLFAEIFRFLLPASDIDTYFMEIVKEHAITFFNFVQVVSMTRVSPEKLFKILDLYKTLRGLLPDIDLVFNKHAENSIHTQVRSTLFQLTETSRKILHDFENSLKCELSKIASVKEGVHPLTNYVMSYLIKMVNLYKLPLMTLISSVPSIEKKSLGDHSIYDVEITGHDCRSPLAMHLIWIVTILLYNLEGKSKHHKNASFGHLFMANNVQYIVDRTYDCAQLRELIGGVYVEKLRGNIQVAISCYKNLSWNKILEELKDDLPVKKRFRRRVLTQILLLKGKRYSSNMKPALKMKQNIRAFNTMFEEVLQSHSRWLVPSQRLAKEIHESILKDLVPAYESFLEQSFKCFERDADMKIKYSVENLENSVLKLFQRSSFQ